MATDNLSDITLKIQTDNKIAAEELAKRDFQVKNIVIQELSEMTSKDLEGKAGKKAFEDVIKITSESAYAKWGSSESLYRILTLFSNESTIS